MTAKDLMESEYLKGGAYIQRAMVEFAKYHVEKALQSAYENSEVDYYHEPYGDHVCIHFVKKDSILNSYPIENIK